MSYGVPRGYTLTRGARPPVKVYSYAIDVCSENEWKVLELLQYNKDWVDFISKSRLEGFETNYDIICDRMADNRYNEISASLQEYIAQNISANDVIARIRWMDSKADQYCFKNKQVLALLKDRIVIEQFKDEKGRWKQEKR